MSEAAEDTRRNMLADLEWTVARCTCEWPLERYCNGDGHRSGCPAHRGDNEPGVGCNLCGGWLAR